MTYVNTQYHYDAGAPCITCQSGAIAMPGLKFEHGYDIYLEDATLRYNNLVTGDEIWIYDARGNRRALAPKRPDAFLAQLQHAVDCVRKGHRSALIDASSARMALAVCLKEQQAVLTDKTVRIGK